MGILLAFMFLWNMVGGGADPGAVALPAADRVPAAPRARAVARPARPPEAEPPRSRLRIQVRTSSDRAAARATGVDDDLPRPVKDMLFCMQQLADLDASRNCPATRKPAPTPRRRCSRNARVQRGGDRAAEPQRRPATVDVEGRRRHDHAGLQAAYRQFAEGGWQGLQHPAEFGGQGLPKTIGAACIEINNSANLSFALCPLLTDGAIEALLTAGTAAQAGDLVPRMISASGPAR